MKKAEIKKENPYSFSDLSLLFNTKSQFIQRDVAVLKKYKITPYDSKILQSIYQELKDTEQDSELVVQQKDVTKDKNILFVLLFKTMKFLRTAMENSISINEMKSQVPTIFNLSSQKNSQLLQSAGSALRVAEMYQPVLLRWGVSNDFLDQFRTLISDCESKLFEKGTVKSARNQNTAKRTQTANNAYKTLQGICKVGRMVWELEGDTAKYNDYLLPSAKHLSSKATPLTPDDTPGEPVTNCPLKQIPASPSVQNPAETADETKSESKA
jgi:hypothetical protein